MKQLRRFAVLSMIVVLSVGCAVTYQPDTGKGGYSSQQVKPQVYDVQFMGNVYNDNAQVRQYLMKRCAELTLETGNDHFVIIEDRSHELMKTQRFLDSNLSVTTHSSMSGGQTTRVHQEFGLGDSGAEPIAAFTIFVRQGPDPSFPSASVNAAEYLNTH